jgi:hypothetical protein
VVSRYVTDITLGAHGKCPGYDGTNNRTEGTCELSEGNLQYVSSKTQLPAERHHSNVTRGTDMKSCIENVDNSSRSTVKLLHDLDEQRRVEVKDAIKRRLLKLEEDSLIHELDFNSKLQHFERETEAKALHEQKLILHRLQEEEIRARERQQQLAQELKQHAKVRYSFVKDSNIRRCVT